MEEAEKGEGSTWNKEENKTFQKLVVQANAGPIIRLHLHSLSVS